MIWRQAQVHKVIKMLSHKRRATWPLSRNFRSFNILNNGKILLKNPLGCPLGCLAEQPALTWAKEKVTKKTQLSWQYSLKSDNSKLTYTFHDFSFSSENDRFPSSHQTVNISYPSYTSKCHAFNTCGNDPMFVLTPQKRP